MTKHVKWIAMERVFSGKNHVEWHNDTRIIDKLAQSPEGRWNPSVSRYGRTKKHGDDLSNERVPFEPDRFMIGMEIGPVTTMVLKYEVAFTNE